MFKTVVTIAIVYAVLEALKALLGFPVTAALAALVLGFCLGRMYEFGRDDAPTPDAEKPPPAEASAG